MRAKITHISGIPVLKNILGKFNEQAVAFHVGLFPKEIHQLVVAHGQFVHFCRDVPELTFRTDFTEINGKDPEKLFDQTVRGSDIRVEQSGNIFLNEVRIADKNTAHFQINNQRRNQFFCPAGFHADNFQPGTNIHDMGRIHLNLPFFV